MKESLIAEMYSLIAEQEAMHWKNVYRQSLDQTIAYDEEHFWYIANRLKEISIELKNN